jgi:hypothetical protein
MMSFIPVPRDDGDGPVFRARKVEIEDSQFFAMVYGDIAIIHMDDEPVLYGTRREDGLSWSFVHAVCYTERMPKLPYDVYDHVEFGNQPDLVSVLRWLHDRAEEYFL